MVVPLFSGSGMRVKIIEGMALSKTIITTTLGVEGIGVTNGKNIIIADDKDEFINQIEFLLSNQTSCDSIGKNARAFILENYDIRKITTNLIAFYLKFIKWS